MVCQSPLWKSGWKESGDSSVGRLAVSEGIFDGTSWNLDKGGFLKRCDLTTQTGERSYLEADLASFFKVAKKASTSTICCSVMGMIPLSLK